MSELPAHSSLGASSAERWINCPGSVALIKKLSLPESDEEDWRTEGIAAHELGAHCLKENDDPWAHIGLKVGGVEVTLEMSNAVQTYVDYCRSRATAAAKQVYVEYRVHQPTVHPLFFGTLDYCVIYDSILDITDYKHGVGIAVDVEDNPQLMYYAYGILKDHPEIKRVRLTIVQPRGFHPDGPRRPWKVEADYIRSWAEKTLVPAMLRTQIDNTLDPGSWCRFCPAKLVCPVLVSLFGAAALADANLIVNLSEQALSLSWQKVDAVKFYIKALQGEAFQRANAGKELPDLKLVYQKANRVWKSDAEAVFKGRFGEKAYSYPEFKSPAEMDSVAPEAPALVKEYAYTPKTNLTLAHVSDKRPAVPVQTAAEVFSAAVETLTGPMSVVDLKDGTLVMGDNKGILTDMMKDELQEIPAFLRRTI